MKKLILIFLIILLFPFLAIAGTFKVFPAKLFLDSEKKTEILKIINDTSEKANLQMSAVKWTQDAEGKDVYEPTQEIVFYPKMLTTKENGEAIIRVGYQSKEAITVEKTYRLFVRELPVSKTGETALKMTVNMGVPVFVSPGDKKKKTDKAQQVSIEKIEIADKKLLIKIKNSGNTHAVVQKISVIGSDDKNTDIFKKDISGWYILPGVLKTFAVDISSEECRNAKVADVSVEVEKTVLKAKTNL